jgi:hypothetical protein
MKKREWSDRWVLACLVLVSLRCTAQDSFHYRAWVDTPRETDFYRIVLSPDLVAHSKTDLSDLRVLEADGRFVPYVLKEDAADSGGLAYQPVPEPVILQKDSSDRRSYLTLSWNNLYRIDRLSLAIRYPILYKRDARIFSKATDGTWYPVTSISIDPRDTSFRLPAVRTSSLLIEIANADNAPLRIVGISAKQAGICLLTYLQGGASYALLTGNAQARFPQYDLGYFTDSLSRRPREISAGPAQETVVLAGGATAPLVKTMDKPGRAGFLLWSILSTVLLLLIYFSVRMVGAIGAKKTPHDRV